MKTSESIANIAKAIASAQKEFKPVPKNKIAKIKTKNNADYTYMYADLADILSMALPCLAANGIAFLQPNIRIDGKLYVVTLLVHESGEWMQSDGIEVDEMEMKWNDFKKEMVLERCDPRTIGGDFTYYRRYDGCSMLGIAPDEDVDAANHGNLPDKRGKNTTDAESTVKTQLQQSVAKTQPKTQAEVVADGKERANAQQQEAQHAQGKFIIEKGTEAEPGEVLICIPKSATKKTTAPSDKNPHGREYMEVILNGRYNGFNSATCFDTKLFDALLFSVGKESEFKLKLFKTGDKFVNIVDVYFINGVEYVDGKEVQEDKR